MRAAARYEVYDSRCSDVFLITISSASHRLSVACHCYVDAYATLFSAPFFACYGTLILMLCCLICAYAARYALRGALRYACWLCVIRDTPYASIVDGEYEIR